MQGVVVDTSPGKLASLLSGAATSPPFGAPTGYADEQLKVVCRARSRIPTPHGDVMLHFYVNDRDQKEHLAFVFDRHQLSGAGDPAQYLRSRSLEAVWRDGETEEERVVRGAYVGRLIPSHVQASSAASLVGAGSVRTAPLVRVHSECFTGETMGSQRCDCGEQLDEAFRLASREGRGIIIYLRQEGRGLGLFEKLRINNLEDMGHDTCVATQILGHEVDPRTYDIAVAMLTDLGIDRIRLLTNNPSKISQIARLGIRVLERVPMVPRSWRLRLSNLHPSVREAKGCNNDSGEQQEALRVAGVGMLGASTTTSPELERYLAAKVEKLGHMLTKPGDHWSGSM